MPSLVTQLINLFAAVLLLLSSGLLAQRRVRSLIHLFTLQGLVLAASTTTMAYFDRVVVSNRPYASHAWAAPGDYAVVLRAYNESLPGGVSSVSTIRLAAPVTYVAAGNTHPQPPYTSWVTAATNNQDAVDALPGTLVVLVTNGPYAGEGIVNTPLAVRSVNGPQFTLINGGGTHRCAFLTNGASLTGFKLTNGGTDYGGGVRCASTNASLTNCAIVGNSAYYGGGASGGTLYNCTRVIPIRLRHGPRFVVLGFRLGNVAYCTDTNAIPDESWPLLEGLDVLILDALRPRPHATHFSLDEAVAVSQRVGARRTLFTHISHELEHQATNDRLPAGMELAYDGQRIALTGSR